MARASAKEWRRVQRRYTPSRRDFGSTYRSRGQRQMFVIEATDCSDIAGTRRIVAREIANRMGIDDRMAMLDEVELVREPDLGPPIPMNQARAFCIEFGLAMRVGGGGFHADIRRHLANAENDLTLTGAC